MNNQEFNIEIPERFYSDAEGKPFENCQVCGKYLLDEGTSYVVEKAFKNYKGYDFSTTLFEYAICTDCHTKVQQSMSKESMRNLQQYYMQILAEKGNQPIVINIDEFKLEDWISKCFFTNSPVQSMQEYQLIAQFNGSKMLMNMPPMVVGETAMEEMAGLLSNQTIDEMNDFKNKFLGPDPELEEIISGKKLILI